MSVQLAPITGQKKARVFLINSIVVKRRPIEIKVQAILSDMDGTLVDSTPAVEGALSKWAIQQGVEPETFFAVSHGVRTRDNIRRFQTVPKPGKDMTEDELTEAAKLVEYSIAEEGRLLKQQGGRGIEKLPGVEKFVNALKQGGARWGIVTSATKIYASSALTTSQIGMSSSDGGPPFVITADNVTHGKPHPEPYLAGLEALRQLSSTTSSSFIEPSKVLVLEDAPSGLQSGMAAGCQTLAVCTGQPREKIRQTPSTFKTVDFDRVQVISCSNEEIVLRITTLQEEEDQEQEEQKARAQNLAN
ncbi:DL-glycerol-3-phosphatase [Microbotryomycetes sp. JL221]|nr:DL-glycerol-3-phosphatase [Microbotryomycetes sp. JL221]